MVVKISCHGGQVPWSRSKAEEIIKKNLILAAGKIKKIPNVLFLCYFGTYQDRKKRNAVGLAQNRLFIW